MENGARTVAKNAGVLMSSQVITWVLTLLLTIFLPRYLGPEAVGQIHLATSLWAIVAVLVAWGMDLFVTKEVARAPEQAPRIFGTAMWVSMGLYLLGSLALAGYTALAGYGAETVFVIAVSGFTHFFIQFNRITRALLQGLERMEFISLAEISSKLFNTIVVITLLLLGYGLPVVIWVFAVTAFLSWLLQLLALARLTPLSMRFRWSDARWLLREGTPYLSAMVFRTLYVQIDIVVISLLVNETVVGWYGQADQIFGTLLFVPTVFITALFPSLSRMFQEAPERLPAVMRRSFVLLLVISVPVGLGILVVAENLSVLLFGEAFRNSGPVLAVMGLVTLLTYQTMLLGRFLIAADRQKVWAIVLAVAAAATIPLDLVLVPWTQATWGNGGIGGAIAFVITEGGMVIFGLSFLPRGTLTRESAWQAARTLLAGGVMVAATWFLRDMFIAIPIAVGAVVYLSLIWLLRVVPVEDRALLQEFVTKAIGKVRGRISPARA